MTNVAEANSLLGPSQYGFRRGRSTADAVMVLTALMQKAKRKSWPYSAAFIDISKVGSENYENKHTIINIQGI